MKKTDTPIADKLLAKDAEIEELRVRLEEAEETLRAIREGEVDAVIVSGSKGDRVFALSESDSLHRLMVETMNEAGLAATPDGLLVFCNDRAAALFGRTKEQLLGHDLAEFADPAEAERVRQLLRTASAAPADARIAFRAAPGMPVPMHVWASRLDRPDSPLICLVATDLSRVEADRDLIAQLQRQREQLRESEERLRLAQGYGGVGVWDWNVQNNQLALEPELEQLYGLLPGSIRTYQDWASHVHPVDLARVEAERATALDRRQPFQVEFRIRHATGSERWIMAKGRGEYDDAGRLLYVRGVNIDITERKLGEEQTCRLHETIAQEKDRLSALVNSITDEIWFADSAGQYTLVNPAGCREFLLSTDGGTDIWELAASLEVCRPDGSSRPVEEAPSLRALCGEMVRNQEEQVRIPATGELRWRQVNAAPVRNTAGQVIGSVSIVRDITERKQTEAALRESRDQFRVMGESVDYGVWMCNAEGGVEYVSQSFLELLDMSMEDNKQFGWTQRLVPEDVPGMMERWLHCIRTGDLWDSEHRIIDRHGQIRTVLTRGKPVRNGEGKITCWVGVNLDITARKEAERALAQLNAELEQRVRARTAELAATNRELEAFCYSVSHDLRSPLRSMDGFSHALMEDYGSLLDDTGRDFLNRVRSNSQRMGRLIDDLLQLSRLTRAHMRYVRVDLTELAEAIFDELRQADPSRTVEVRVAPDLTATGDPVLLRTALTNLLGNAWKFTGRRPDALIEVGAERLPVPAGIPVPSPVFYVRDNGAGFDPKYADKLFTPFQRLHAMEDFPGSGIGLATVQRVIHRHGGRVWFESAPGQGATFYFTVGANAEG
jgi:PAS domain S-box-containing protein